MAPIKSSTDRGSLFDLFPERPQAVHGGARFDEGFNLQNKGAPNGQTFDEFGTPSHNGDHGQLWDEWGWKDMPELHGGLLYDDGFVSPTANTSKQGNLFDLFEPSTQVKFIYDGKDSEGIVDHVDGEDVFVRQRGSANVVPVGLSQFLAFRSPSLDNTATVAERSDAEAPSAWSPDAHGGEREAGEPYGQPIMPTPQGQATEERSGVPEGRMNIVDQLKSLLSDDDIQKAAKDYGMHQVHPGYVQHTFQGKVIGHSRDSGDGVVTHAKAAGKMDNVGSFVSHDDAHSVLRSRHEGAKIKLSSGQMASNYQKMHGGPMVKTQHLPSELLKSCSVWSGVTSVAKEVTVAEAAIQAEEGAAPFSGKKGAGSYCPECRVNVKPSEDGRCPTCQMALKAHEGHKIVPREKGDGNGSAEDSAGKGVAEKTSVLDDLRKAFGAGGDPMPGGQTVTLTGKPEQKDSNKGQARSDPSGPVVPERAHAESDHNEDKSKPRTCPHCGMPLKELDDKTGEGAPSDVEPDVAHKCLEGMMDTFKTHEEPVSALDSLRGLVAA